MYVGDSKVCDPFFLFIKNNWQELKFVKFAAWDNNVHEAPPNDMGVINFHNGVW